MAELDLKEIVSTIDKLGAEFKEKQNEAKEVAAKALEEIKLTGKAQDETKREVTAVNEKMSTVEARLQELEQKADAAVAQHNFKAQPMDAIKCALESDEFKAFASKKASKANIEVEDLWSVKAVTTAAASAGVALNPQLLPGVFGEPEYALTIRALLAPGSTSAQLIRYVKEGVFTDNTGMVAEEAQKPKSDLTLTDAETRVRKIANLMDVSMEAREDLPFLESYMRSKMMRGLLLKEEEQLLLGDGTGENLLGLLPQSTTFDDALLTQMDIQNPTVLDRLFAAYIQVTLSEYAPTAFVMNPINYGGAIMRKTTDGAYLMANPAASNTPRIWGLPVVTTPRMAVGTFLTGAFRDAAQIFDRKSATITISEENKDNIERNMFTLRIEERLALAVYSENAFVSGTTAPASGGGQG